MTDVDVARRVQLSQPRYAQYVNDANEPDLTTLVRICRALDVSPEYVLGLEEAKDGTELDVLQARAIGAIRTMSLARVRIAVALLDALTGVPDAT